MTNRERVHRAIRRQGFDALPWQFDLTSRAAARLAAFLGVEDVHAAIGDHMAWTGVGLPEGAAPDEPSGETQGDEFGAVWRRSARDREYGDWGELVNWPLSEPTLAGLRLPDGAAPGRCRHIPAVRRAHPEQFLVAGCSALFERGWSLCGLENYLAWIGGAPRFVEELNDRLATYACQVTAQLAGLDVDGVRFGDDWGLQGTLMVSPDTWRRLFKPYYRRIYAAARDAGLVVMIHSCGNITDLLPDLVELGVQVVHPLQPEAMDVERCRRAFGRDLAFWGGLGSQSTLPHGTKEDCRREARQRLRQFAAGGYILAPAGAAPTETPPENLAAVVEAAREQLR